MILFDVGANFGTDSLYKVAHNPDMVCYAFEPTMELVGHLARASRSLHIEDRYIIQPIALSNFDGKANFNIASHADWGISSLLEFSDNLDKTWPDRTDFYVDRVEEVLVMRLDTWFKTIQPDTGPAIQKIDFFHCDTQGSDLAVLKGMGDYIDLIVEGVVEVPQSAEVKLYKNQFLKEEMEEFLTSKGFEIYQVNSQQNEDNLCFRKAGTDLK